MNNKPNFSKATALANEILLNSHVITTFPVDIFGHIREESDLKLYSFETAIQEFGLDPTYFGSDDALITERGGKHILLYRRDTNPQRRIWSVTHECGHFYQGHELDHRRLSDAAYKIQEVEAHFFSAQLLMPDQIIWELARRRRYIDAPSLVRWFGVSTEAANKRIKTLNKQQSYLENHCYPTDERFLIKFGSFIEEISPTQSR